jgi:spermidine/putrescine transport system permease protein
MMLAIPFGWFMARTSSRGKQVLQLLVIIPFWTNFLIRIFAWKTLLNQDGLMTRAAAFLGLIPAHESLLYNDGAVLLVLVYTHLPFAILPIYAAAEKFDFSLLDAAQDLGASQLRSFFEVFLPGIKMGIAAGALMVFVPALGSFLIPEMMGGHDSEMLGSRISQRAFADRNLPEASALASGLVIGVLSATLFIGGGMAWWRQFKRRQA